MKRYLSVILGSIIIGVTYNLFFLPYDIVPNGIYGIGALLNYEFNYEPFMFFVIVNVALLLITIITNGIDSVKKYLLPTIIIPFVILLTEGITNYIEIDNIEMLLITIIGGFLTGFGYSLIYKQGFSVGGMDIIQDVINSAKHYRRKTFSYLIEVLVLIGAYFVLDLESVIYSLIVIVIIRYMATKSKIGISSNKTFFIITSKENEVKDYIINDLKYDLTLFDVKGGFSNIKTKIIMTAIDTKDYYKLKEGVSIIDPKAFISIMDGYEVINKNVYLKEHQK